MLSQILRAGGHLDGILLEAVTMLGVPSAPQRVLANGVPVEDFSYRSDTQVGAAPPGGAPGPWDGADSAFASPGAACLRVAANVGAVCGRLVLSR